MRSRGWPARPLAYHLLVPARCEHTMTLRTARSDLERYHAAVLIWLLWIIAAVLAAVLLMWLLLIAVVVVGSVASLGLCPRCGLALADTDRDRFPDDYFDPRYHRNPYDYCARCGWRRSDDG